MSRIVNGFCWYCLDRLFSRKSWEELDRAVAREDQRLISLYQEKNPQQ